MKHKETTGSMVCDFVIGAVPFCFQALRGSPAPLFFGLLWTFTWSSLEKNGFGHGKDSRKQ